MTTLRMRRMEFEPRICFGVATAYSALFRSL